MSIIEVFGLFLSIAGLAFAFETPRNWFLKLFDRYNLPKTTTLPEPDASTEKPPLITENVSPDQEPQPLRISKDLPHTDFEPLRVKFRDGQAAFVAFRAVIRVQPHAAATFIAIHGTYENGVAICKELIESVVRSTLEEQPSSDSLRVSRSHIEYQIENRIRSKLAGTSLTLTAVGLGGMDRLSGPFEDSASLS